MTDLSKDPYLGTCVAGWGSNCGRPTGGPRKDFCEEHADEATDNFGRCYQCHDGHHQLCVGVPCQCACPTPEQRDLRALVDKAREKLTPEEFHALTQGRFP